MCWPDIASFVMDWLKCQNAIGVQVEVGDPYSTSDHIHTRLADLKEDICTYIGLYLVLQSGCT